MTDSVARKMLTPLNTNPLTRVSSAINIAPGGNRFVVTDLFNFVTTDSGKFVTTG